MAATALFVVGALLALAGAIMVLIAAFREGFWWGVGSFLLWPVQLIFVVTHWAETKKGFLTSVCGVGILIAGVLLTPHKAPQPAVQTEAAAVPQTTTHATFEQVTATIPDAEEVKPQPRPAPQPVAAPVEEPPQPVVAKVYVDNTTKLYYASDCATHPDNAFRMSKALAVSQGYKPGVCK
ncbi:MAG TPA: hypothetical protein VKU62_11910 [Thermoanaerobaculia bacterium]|nr:hypothetical protein [Thermoanaerobaculia bacterium]